jgi:hypothetical protein
MGVFQRTSPDMFVTVNAGIAFIAAASAVGGVYTCHNDAPFDVLLATAHASLPRRDLVVARVYDAYDDVGSRNEWAIECITGTPDAIPVTPTTPTGATALAQVTVPAGATSIVTANIADVRQYTTALGGTLPVASQAQRDAVAPYVGMKVFRLDVGVTETYTGSSWDAGGVVSSDFASDGAYNVDGTFTEFTNTQWPYVEVPCPASGALAVTIRGDAVNSNSISSSIRFGVNVRDMTAGGGIVINSNTRMGPAIVRSIAQETSFLISSERFFLGGGGELAGLTGHTLRCVPTWYISSHTNPKQDVNSGRLYVEPLPVKYTAT